MFKLESKLRDKVLGMVKHEFKDRDYNFDKIVDQIQEIFQFNNRKLISIFEFDLSKQESDLDEAILNAFSKANAIHQMAELCLSWNRVDIAKKTIFKDDFDEDVILVELNIILNTKFELNLTER